MNRSKSKEKKPLFERFDLEFDKKYQIEEEVDENDISFADIDEVKENKKLIMSLYDESQIFD